MENIMLDLETMGTGPSAAIIAIGAVAFDLETGTLGPHFYQVVDLASSVACGGTIDPATVIWWMEQSDAARHAFRRVGGHLPQTLTQFADWVTHVAGQEAKVWGNGAAFDNVVLASAYDRAEISRPWAFWNDRCYRTVKALHPHVKLERVGTHHNALEDAESQALHLMAILNANGVPSGS